MPAEGLTKDRYHAHLEVIADHDVKMNSSSWESDKPTRFELDYAVCCTTWQCGMQFVQSNRERKVERFPVSQTSRRPRHN